MAGSRKRPSVEGAARAFLRAHDLRGMRVAVGLSGGVDSVVLLHLLRALAKESGFSVSAIHVHHGLNPNADAWARFCRALCRRWKIPLAVRRVRVIRNGAGLEAAARAARYRCYGTLRTDVIALGHQLDDQAETVLMNLLRGAGLAGASGMRASAPLHEKLVVRPLLEVPRAAITRYARANRLDWIEDDSNRDESLSRNYLRQRVGPLLEARYPRWRESLSRAARHFAQADADANRLLRSFLKGHGLRAPSETKLAEMLRQITQAKRGGKVRFAHDGKELRVYRDKVVVQSLATSAPFDPVRWTGQTKLALPQLGGELTFRTVRGSGIDRSRMEASEITVRLRSGGEKLQIDSQRPRRTLKNLFQEAGVPPWERARLPLLFCGTELIWAPGLGVDARYRARRGAPGILPRWKK
jgi:tRNA(Ile)-lysidine synthase